VTARVLLSCFVAMSFLWSCTETSIGQRPSTTASVGTPPKAEIPARPSFSKGKVRIRGHVVNVEIADEDHERSYGLMFITTLANDHGMLFLFESEQILAFWMKNTKIPLSIAYIDQNKTIIDIQEMQPAEPNDQMPRTYPSRKPARYALEVNQGWFERKKIKVGDRVEFLF